MSTVVTDMLAGLSTEQKQQAVIDLLLSKETASGAWAVGNARDKFRDGFADPLPGGMPDAASWTVSNPDGHLVTQGGNAFGASYVQATLDPRLDDTEVSMVSVQTFEHPFRAAFQVSASQRVVGHESAFGFTELVAGAPVPIAQPDDFPLGACTVSVSSNVATVTAPAGVEAPFVGGERVTVYGFADGRLNVGPVAVTRTGFGTFTFPATLGNGSYATTGAFVRRADPLRWARNSAVFLFGDSTNAATGSYYSRRNGTSWRGVTNRTTASTTASQSTTNPYSDAFVSSGVYEVASSIDELSFRTFASDSTGGVVDQYKFSQSVPDNDWEYGLHCRLRALKGSSKIVGQIASVSKSGSTTATVTTSAPHGLAVGNWVVTYGVRDQTNFANITTPAAVASVPSATTFTVTWGSSATASSTGGSIWLVQGGTATMGQFAGAVQSVYQLNGVTFLTGSATWSTPLPGEIVFLHGTVGAGVDGYYKVLRINTTVAELKWLGGVRDDFVSVNCGGSLTRPTTVRLHSARMMAYTRHAVEVTGGRASNDSNNALPVFGNVIPAATNNRLGFVAKAGVWIDSTSTALAASATYTGSSNDMFGATTGTAFNATNYPAEYRVSALADVAGTLYLEVSKDATTWRRVKSVAAVQNAGSGQPFYAELSHSPSTRYVRAVFVNGATAQTYFLLQETRLG